MHLKKKISPETIKETKSLIYVMIFALMIRTFILEIFFVPTGSMKATILENDYIFSTKYSYGYSNYSLPFSPNLFSGRILAQSPERGDIVVFRPPNNMEIRYVKRLIGLPGDKVQLMNDIVYINDIPVKREEIGHFTDEKGNRYKTYKEILPNGKTYTTYYRNHHEQLLNNNRFNNTSIFYVPQNHYFFLGDNRDESNDSRVELGFVPFENFIAKGQFVVLSTREVLWADDLSIIQRLSRFWHWLFSFRLDRIFKRI